MQNNIVSGYTSQEFVNVFRDIFLGTRTYMYTVRARLISDDCLSKMSRNNNIILCTSMIETMRMRVVVIFMIGYFFHIVVAEALPKINIFPPETQYYNDYYNIFFISTSW